MNTIAFCKELEPNLPKKKYNRIAFFFFSYVFFLGIFMLLTVLSHWMGRDVERNEWAGALLMALSLPVMIKIATWAFAKPQQLHKALVVTFIVQYPLLCFNVSRFVPQWDAINLSIDHQMILGPIILAASIGYVYLIGKTKQT